MASSSISPIVTKCYSREGAAHWVFHSRHPLLLWRKKIILPYFITIREESVVKKSVGQKEVATNNGKVQKFTKDKATEIDIVLVMDVSAEELD